MIFQNVQGIANTLVVKPICLTESIDIKLDQSKSKTYKVVINKIRG